MDKNDVENKGTDVKEILKTIFYFLAIITFSFLIVTFVGQRTVVHGESMESTLKHGDNLIVEKMYYHFHEPNRFDIIVFPFQYNKKQKYIKRIIGLPGETIRIEENTIYINDEVLKEDFGNEPMNSPGIAQETITLGSDEYFVLGDNRNNSTDSRTPEVGLIKRKTIIGRAWVRIWPLNHLGKLEH
jgi:signal peptidase I